MGKLRVLTAASAAVTFFATCTQAVSVTLASTSTSGKATVTKVASSLEVLLKSVEEVGQDSDRMLRHSKKWCDATLLSYQNQADFARTEIDHLGADLLEQQAAVEEAQGTLAELRAQAKMINHTMSLTQSVLEDAQMNASLSIESRKSEEATDPALLSKLLQGKTMALASVEGKLEALVPALAELEAQAAETKRQVDNRRESIASMSRLAHSVKESCAGVVRRTDARASARVGQAQLIEAALQALDGVVNSAPSGHEVSFLQVAKQGSASEQLLSIFGDSDDASDTDAVSSVETGSGAEEKGTTEATGGEAADDGSDVDDAGADGASGGVVDIFAAAATLESGADSDDGKLAHAEEAHAGGGIHDSVSVSQSPSGAGVKALLAKVKSEGLVGDEQREWCEKELAHNKLMLQLAQDAASRAAASIEAHADIQNLLAEDSKRVSAEIAQLDAVVKEAVASANVELDHLRKNEKEQALATGILSKGVAVLRELGVTGTEATQDLIVARNTFQAQRKDWAPLQRDVEVNARKIRELAEEARRALRRESHGLVMASDSHNAKRSRSVRGKAAYEAEAQGAMEYLNKLKPVCQASLASAEKWRRQAEVHLLEDTEEALEGHRVGREGSLRGTTKKATVDMDKLSPIERAALEMGVPVDES
eukprot:TRINITY_DN50899_c0_g1_i1.p1 TRINITY_DN50899_c0_g1~~TRINITY_DN50899_c0_g1_i1.p1  ORF type:complete len:654 (-),score=148.08 TRINITY_DN50899_c0_g1_i1:94-2055(-)